VSSTRPSLRFAAHLFAAKWIGPGRSPRGLDDALVASTTWYFVAVHAERLEARAPIRVDEQEQVQAALRSMSSPYSIV
jgi:hypothetical protein